MADPRTGPLIRVPKRHQLRVEQEGPRVRLLLDGKLVFDTDWRGAEDVGWHLLKKSRDAKKAAGILT